MTVKYVVEKIIRRLAEEGIIPYWIADEWIKELYKE